jgi:hypothetical protein
VPDKGEDIQVLFTLFRVEFSYNFELLNLVIDTVEDVLDAYL